MTLDLSKVPHLAERQAIKALEAKKWAINDERIAALKGQHARDRALFLALQKDMQAARAQFDAAMEAAQAKFDAEHAPLEVEMETLSRPFVDRMLAVQEEIEAAVAHLDVEPLWSGADQLGDVRTCAVSDLPLFTRDACWVHVEAGMALMCLLPPIYEIEEAEEIEPEAELVQAAE